MSLLTVIASLCLLCQTAPSPAPGAAEKGQVFHDEAQRVEDWRADLAALAQQLPDRHVNPFTRVTREQFDAAVAQLDGRIPELNDYETTVELMKLVASIGDAHTSLAAVPGQSAVHFRHYPLGVYLFADGPFVTVAPGKHRALIGAKLVGIGAVGFDEAAARVATVFPSENDSHRKHQLPRWLTNAEVLHALKVTDGADIATFTFRMPDGAEQRVELSPIAVSEAKALSLVRAPDWSAIATTRPVSLTPHGGAKYWFEPLDDGQTVYCRYDACTNDPKKPFAEFAKELLAYIDANDVPKVIVDLRSNGGGDSRIAQPLIDGLRKRANVNKKGHLFVLIGRATFSSAQMNAADFRRRTSALLVGEPTGQKPNHFGEVRTFTLPNSALVVQHSTKAFKMSEDDAPSMVPDITVEQSSADFFAGRDVVLDAVLRYQD